MFDIAPIDITTTTTPARRQRLRGATQAAMSAFDRLIDSSCCCESHQGYVAYIAAMARWHSVADAALRRAGVTAVWPRWLHYRPCAALAADLRFLSHDSTAEPVDPLLLPLVGRGAVFGTLYVLLGSSLGARVLTRRAQTLGYDANNGAAFLAAQSDAAALWQSFLADVDAAALDDLAEARMMGAARAAFTLAQRFVREERVASAISA